MAVCQILECFAAAPYKKGSFRTLPREAAERSFRFFCPVYAASFPHALAVQDTAVAVCFKLQKHEPKKAGIKKR
jgi:hypothetical protein